MASWVTNVRSVDNHVYLIQLRRNSGRNTLGWSIHDVVSRRPPPRQPKLVNGGSNYHGNIPVILENRGDVNSADLHGQTSGVVKVWQSRDDVMKPTSLQSNYGTEKPRDPNNKFTHEKWLLPNKTSSSNN